MGVIRKYTHHAVMQRKYMAGEVTALEKMDVYYQSHGFIDNSDFNAQVRLTVLKIIASHSEYEYPHTEKSIGMDRVINIINKFKNVSVDFKCYCCKITFDYHFITIDHTDNNGVEHRKDRNTLNLSSYIIRHGFNSKYKIVLMCCDCNHELGAYGYCHHHLEIVREIKCGKRKTIEENNELDETNKMRKLFA